MAIAEAAARLPLTGPSRQVQQRLEIRFAAQTAALILQGALRREESRGAHFREDFPQTGDLETTAFTRVTDSGGNLDLEMVPVAFDIVRPGQSLIDDDAGAPPATDKSGAA